MKFMERAAQILDIPADIIAGLPRLQIVGCREVLMENHRGILEYGSKSIHINGGEVIVKFKGEDLVIRAMNSEELRLQGRIDSIEFLY